MWQIVFINSTNCCGTAPQKKTGECFSINHTLNKHWHECRCCLPCLGHGEGQLLPADWLNHHGPVHHHIFTSFGTEFLWLIKKVILTKREIAWEKWQNVNVHIISIAPMINSFGDKEHCFVVLPVLQNLKKTTTGITIKTMQVALGHTIGKKILAEQNAWPLANAAMDTVFHAQFTHVCFSLHVLFQTKTLVKNRCCV